MFGAFHIGSHAVVLGATQLNRKYRVRSLHESSRFHRARACVRARGFLHKQLHNARPKEHEVRISKLRTFLDVSFISHQTIHSFGDISSDNGETSLNISSRFESDRNKKKRSFRGRRRWRNAISMLPILSALMERIHHPVRSYRWRSRSSSSRRSPRRSQRRRQLRWMASSR